MVTTTTPRLAFVIVQTYCVQPPARRHQAPYYEITFAPDTYPDAPRTILITRDESIYLAALDAEGSDRHFTFTRHFDGRALVLDQLTEVHR